MPPIITTHNVRLLAFRSKLYHIKCIKVPKFLHKVNHNECRWCQVWTIGLNIEKRKLEKSGSMYHIAGSKRKINKLQKIQLQGRAQLDKKISFLPFF